MMRAPKPLRSILLLAVLLLAVSLVGACSDDDPTGEPDVADVSDDTASDTAVDTMTVDTADDTGEHLDTTEPDTADADDTVDDTADDIHIDDIADDTGADVAPECTSLCDCDQGYACVSGACELGTDAVLCCENAGCTEGKSCSSADGTPGLCGVATSPVFGDILFNEVLSDGAVTGDPNGDGDFPDASGDEFVELVNVSSASVNLDGFTLVESDLVVLPRHTFGASDTLAAGTSLVIFGGGTAPDDVQGAHFVVANAADPGISLGLHLDNSGDAVRLLDGDGLLVAIFAFGPGATLEAITDQSYTRNPDLTGDFVPHTDVTSAEGPFFSPGTRADGTHF